MRPCNSLAETRPHPVRLVAALPATPPAWAAPPGHAPTTAVATGHAKGPAIGSLCSGYGGLDLAALAVLGGYLAWVADNGRGPAAVLAARLPGVANLGDLTRVEWATVPRVDVVTAGFPCQDISCAGRGAGIEEGARSGIWAHIAEALGLLRPGVAFVENVAALRSRGLARVLGDLAALGYDTQWASLRASDIGAAHRRERIFILAWQPAAFRRLLTAAHPSGGELQRRRVAGLLASPPHPAESPAPQRQWVRDATGDCRPAAVRPSGIRFECSHRPPIQSAPGLGSRDCRRTGRPSAAASDTTGHRLRHCRTARGHGLQAAVVSGACAYTASARRREGEDSQPDRGDEEARSRGGQPERTGRERPVGWGLYGPAVHRWERVLGRSAPPPTEPGRTEPRLSPRFVEWLMGLPDGWVTGCGISRSAQLRALGNGVVPQQAAAALRHLIGTAARYAPVPGLAGHGGQEVTT